MTRAAGLRRSVADHQRYRPSVVQLAGLLAMLATWEIAARATAGSFIIAGPSEISIWLWSNAGLTLRALGATLKAAAIGYLFGNIAAVALALAGILLARGERLIAALALVVFCLPLVATGPILRVLFGPGTGPQISLAALSVYYTTYLSLMVGLRAAPACWFDIVRSYGRKRVAELLYVRIFVAAPYFLAGLKIGAPAALLGAMVGEFTGAERGLGVLVIRAMRGLDVPATWSLAMLAASIAMLAYGAVGVIERRFSGASPPVLLAVQTGPSGPRALWYRLTGKLAFGALVTLIVLVSWGAVMDVLELNRFYAKRPADVWNFLVVTPKADENRAVLFGAFGQTLRFAVPGYVAGMMAGAALAAVITVVPRLSGVILPVAIALRSVPIVTTAPLLVLGLGRGAVGSVTVVAVMIFFPTLVACLHGLRQAPGQVLDVFESYAARPIERLLFAQIPAMLPAFFAAARMAVPAALLAATTAEWLATGTGMGSLMAMTASTSAYNMLWSAIALLTVTACLAYAAIGLAERAVLRRYASEQLVR